MLDPFPAELHLQAASTSHLRGGQARGSSSSGLVTSGAAALCIVAAAGAKRSRKTTVPQCEDGCQVGGDGRGWEGMGGDGRGWEGMGGDGRGWEGMGGDGRGWEGMGGDGRGWEGMGGGQKTGDFCIAVFAVFAEKTQVDFGLPGLVAKGELVPEFYYRYYRLPWAFGFRTTQESTSSVMAGNWMVPNNWPIPENILYSSFKRTNFEAIRSGSMLQAFP